MRFVRCYSAVRSGTYIGAFRAQATRFPLLGGNGAIQNGYQSGSNYVMNGYGQSQAVVTAASLRYFGSGTTYQWGTATISAHPTLPLVRWTDPVHWLGRRILRREHEHCEFRLFRRWLLRASRGTTSFANRHGTGGGRIIGLGSNIGNSSGSRSVRSNSGASERLLAAWLGFAALAAAFAAFMSTMFNDYVCEPYCMQPQIYHRAGGAAFNTPADFGGIGGEGSSQMYFAVQ